MKIRGILGILFWSRSTLLPSDQKQIKRLVYTFLIFIILKKTIKRKNQTSLCFGTFFFYKGNQVKTVFIPLLENRISRSNKTFQ